MAEDLRGKVIALFDVDGTLTPARLVRFETGKNGLVTSFFVVEASPEMMETLKKLRTKITIGVVGGSDLEKQKEQLGSNILDLVDYSFPENGLMAFKDGKQFHAQSFKDYLGEEKLKQFINFTLHYIADLDIPKKRGTFIEFRMGMLNVSPIGRNCSHEERNEFEKYDKEHGVRAKMVKVLEEKFGDSFNLKFSIGGQISFDVFPKGWDKTYALQHVSQFTEIHFFGDKTMPGGNDYEIYTSPKVTHPHHVNSPADTLRLLNEIWLSK